MRFVITPNGTPPATFNQNKTRVSKEEENGHIIDTLVQSFSVRRMKDHHISLDFQNAKKITEFGQNGLAINVW